MITFHHEEFELAVREDTSILDRPIEEADLLQIKLLDCSNFDFLHEDLETLEKCKALKTLAINIGMIGLDFLSSLPMLEDLYLVYWGREVDFRAFSCLHKLKSLFVSGGEISNIPFVETDALKTMKNLSSLSFHEFGSVDLSFLENMQWLEEFFCGWADEVSNISAISKLVHLRSLTLMDICLDNLDFLDNLPDTVELEWSVEIARDSYAPEKLGRFFKSEIRSVFEADEYIKVEVW